jgi:eukaryotic-like serine/threonine-protein kinase
MEPSPLRPAYEFGDFRVEPRHRVLARLDGAPIEIGAKAFDALVYLVEHAGTIVTRDELMRALWPRTVVEDNSLNKLIAAIRRALGEQGYIATLQGRGYQFVADVRVCESQGQLEPGKPLLLDERRSSLSELATVPAANEAPAEARESRPPARRARAPKRFGGYVAIAVAALGLAAGAYWLATRDTERLWLLEHAVPEIEAKLQIGDYEAAYALARQAQRRTPDAPELAELWPRFSWRATIPSDPPGAKVFRRPYDRPDARWEELGRTPLEAISIPFGLSVLRFELEGRLPLVRAVGGGALVTRDLARWKAGRGDTRDFWVPPETYKLDTRATLPDRMVRVEGWSQELDGQRVTLRDFFLGRYEVTNAEFKAFVDAGGYRNEAYWDPIVVDGAPMDWTQAVRRFTDRTGRPGPSTWEGGDYPAGQENFPVSGVSWYEAAAFARFAGKELPTAHHWQRGVAMATLPWLLPLSNFSDKARAVGERGAMSDTGAFDMLGNVREWTATASGDQYLILGGTSPDYYLRANPQMASPLDRSSANGLRLAVTDDPPDIAARARAGVPRPPPHRTQVEPVSDELYAAYGRIFAYDASAPLNATIDAAQTTRSWLRQRISFDAAYGHERMALYLYLPMSGKPPYQTVIYWPGSIAADLASIDEYSTNLDFIVKNGRAVAFPVYKGTFERGDGTYLPPFGTTAFRDSEVAGVKDLRRSIDYLETREDIDPTSIAFFGHSWGAITGATVLAQEPRIKTAILYVGFLPRVPMAPEVDPTNALPRVKVPALVLSGEFDSNVPLDVAKRYFALLGTAEADKKHVIEPGGHFVPPQVLIRETLAWLDAKLGEPRN